MFPAQRGGKLSNMAMSMLIRRMGVDGITVQGFRSSFRDWAGEETNFECETVEMALAHIVGNKAERAYRRGQALAEQRALRRLGRPTAQEVLRQGRCRFTRPDASLPPVGGPSHKGGIVGKHRYVSLPLLVDRAEQGKQPVRSRSQADPPGAVAIFSDQRSWAGKHTNIATSSCYVYMGWLDWTPRIIP